MSPRGYSLLKGDFFFHVALQEQICLSFPEEYEDPLPECFTKVDDFQGRVDEGVVDAVKCLLEVYTEY